MKARCVCGHGSNEHSLQHKWCRKIGCNCLKWEKRKNELASLADGVRVAKSMSDLQEGQTVAMLWNGKWTLFENWPGGPIADSYFSIGRVVVLADPPQVSFPTAHGSVIEAFARNGYEYYWMLGPHGRWVADNGESAQPEDLKLTRIHYDAGEKYNDD